MFSRDIKHYRATPRTTSEAFGPYAEYQPDLRIERRERLIDLLGMAASLIGAATLAVAIGLLVGWLG